MDDSFDKIFTVRTIYFWQDVRHILGELYRVLKPNGILNITFSQQESMLQMPSTRFGYGLFDTQKILDFVELSDFTVANIADDTEEIRNEVRYYMDRDFTTISLRKERNANYE